MTNWRERRTFRQVRTPFERCVLYTSFDGERVFSSTAVQMAPANGDFIDGDLTQALEFDAAEPAAQVPFLDVLDEVPADLQMLGHQWEGSGNNATEIPGGSHAATRKAHSGDSLCPDRR